MDFISKPELPDNAENAVKCPQCGNTILIGSETSQTQETVECDVCHASQNIKAGQVHSSSNEEY